VPGLVRTVDLTELRGFCAAADLGSVGRAALRLQMSQPALSKRLHALETLAGVELLERSSRGVRLTPAGRRLYERAQRLLAEAEGVEEALLGLRQSTAPLRLAASHSSTEAFVATALSRVGDTEHRPIELLVANSSVVRGLVADGSADVGVVASRPGATPNPSVREVVLAEDMVVCAVPGGHLWANRRRVSQAEFLRTPLVVRDPASNARWTVDGELRRRGLHAVPPLVQAATPAAARHEALVRNAPLVLSRNVIRGHHFVEVTIDGLSFPRQFMLVLPAVGEPSAAVNRLRDLLLEAASELL
jgi:DNA-binding transcriptional LysR family regulator